MENKIVFVKKFMEISIYKDPYMDSSTILFGRKGNEEVDTGYIYVPTDIWNEGMKNIKGGEIEEKEVNKILEEQNNNFYKYSFAICNVEDKDLFKVEDFIKNKLKMHE